MRFFSYDFVWMLVSRRTGGRGSSEVEDFPKEALLFLPPGIVIAVRVAVLVVIVIVVIRTAVITLGRRDRRRGAGKVNRTGRIQRDCSRACTFDDFIQLSAVEPDAPALWTEVYFDSLTVCH